MILRQYHIGPDKLVAPEQAVVLSTDPTEARAIARTHLATYLEKSQRLMGQVKGAMVYPIGILIIAVAVVVFQIVTDITYAWLDPRIHYD